MNTTKLLLIIGLVYISMNQTKDSTRNMMLFMTGLLGFCMLGKIEGYCKIPSENLDINNEYCGPDKKNYDPNVPLNYRSGARCIGKNTDLRRGVTGPGRKPDVDRDGNTVSDQDWLTILAQSRDSVDSQYFSDVSITDFYQNEDPEAENRIYGSDSNNWGADRLQGGWAVARGPRAGTSPPIWMDEPISIENSHNQAFSQLFKCPDGQVVMNWADWPDSVKEDCTTGDGGWEPPVIPDSVCVSPDSAEGASAVEWASAVDCNINLRRSGIQNINNEWTNDLVSSGNGCVINGPLAHGDTCYLACATPEVTTLLSCDNGSLTQSEQCASAPAAGVVPLLPTVGAAAVGGPIISDAPPIVGNIDNDDGEKFQVDFDAGQSYYIWTDGGGDIDGRINLTLYEADGTTVLLTAPEAPADGYMEFYANIDIRGAIIWVWGKDSSSRGSYQIHVTTHRPAELDRPATRAPTTPFGREPTGEVCATNEDCNNDTTTCIKDRLCIDRQCNDASSSYAAADTPCNTVDGSPGNCDGSGICEPTTDHKCKRPPVPHDYAQRGKTFEEWMCDGVEVQVGEDEGCSLREFNLLKNRFNVKLECGGMPATEGRGWLTQVAGVCDVDGGFYSLQPCNDWINNLPPDDRTTEIKSKWNNLRGLSPDGRRWCDGKWSECRPCPAGDERCSNTPCRREWVADDDGHLEVHGHDCVRLPKPACEELEDLCGEPPEPITCVKPGDVTGYNISDESEVQVVRSGTTLRWERDGVEDAPQNWGGCTQDYMGSFIPSPCTETGQPYILGGCALPGTDPDHPLCTPGLVEAVCLCGNTNCGVGKLCSADNVCSDVGDAPDQAGSCQGSWSNCTDECLRTWEPNPAGTPRAASCPQMPSCAPGEDQCRPDPNLPDCTTREYEDCIATEDCSPPGENGQGTKQINWTGAPSECNIPPDEPTEEACTTLCPEATRDCVGSWGNYSPCLGNCTTEQGTWKKQRSYAITHNKQGEGDPCHAPDGTALTDGLIEELPCETAEKEAFSLTCQSVIGEGCETHADCLRGGADLLCMRTEPNNANSPKKCYSKECSCGRDNENTCNNTDQDSTVTNCVDGAGSGEDFGHTFSTVIDLIPGVELGEYKPSQNLNAAGTRMNWTPSNSVIGFSKTPDSFEWISEEGVICNYNDIYLPWHNYCVDSTGQQCPPLPQKYC